ncbi:MAG: ECF-type riboflavin transporter substrate-binding protein [Lactobacillaceae bacterium]|jgi:energy-coupling factor transport system substrate-specific component|nr:ECF-type riboflavin transporter substrate-binding protein [Lactobacillaceae bacterium]
MKKTNLRLIGAIVIGAIGFFLLMRYIAIPTGVHNTQINFAEGWLSLVTAIFGPIVGLIVALVGHTLNDFSRYDSAWWSWVIADGLFGLLLGLATQRLHLANGTLTVKKIIAFNIWQLIANVIAWLIIAPLGDILIYGEPAKKVFIQGATATGVNFATVAVFGTLLLVGYNKIFKLKN